MYINLAKLQTLPKCQVKIASGQIKQCMYTVSSVIPCTLTSSFHYIVKLYFLYTYVCVYQVKHKCLCHNWYIPLPAHSKSAKTWRHLLSSYIKCGLWVSIVSFSYDAVLWCQGRTTSIIRALPFFYAKSLCKCSLVYYKQHSLEIISCRCARECILFHCIAMIDLFSQI